MSKLLQAVPAIAEAIKTHDWLKENDPTTGKPVGHNIIEGHIAKAMFFGLGNTFNPFNPEDEWDISRPYYESLYFDAFQNPTFREALNKTLAKYGLTMREGEATIAYKAELTLTPQ